MNPDECAICFEAFTPESGHSVLGCGHKFHLMCVVRWFQDQEGSSTCPCCRREAGYLDNIPTAVAATDDDSSVGEWTVDIEYEDGDEDEEEAVGELRPIWTRDPIGGQWERTWVVTGGGVAIWDPMNPEDDVPDELMEGAVALQRIWRGWTVRRQREIEETARILITLKNTEVGPVDDWHYRRFVRVD
jgi:hypothetical protein